MLRTSRVGNHAETTALRADMVHGGETTVPRVPIVGHCRGQLNIEINHPMNKVRHHFILFPLPHLMKRHWAPNQIHEQRRHSVTGLENLVH
jgi:hypothetical protein